MSQHLRYYQQHRSKQRLWMVDLNIATCDRCSRAHLAFLAIAKQNLKCGQCANGFAKCIETTNQMKTNTVLVALT